MADEEAKLDDVPDTDSQPELSLSTNSQNIPVNESREGFIIKSDDQSESTSSDSNESKED